jgi:D-alanyl-lipoteichoic acid acyltransferase DltB (MBOAT superfamily)
LNFYVSLWFFLQVAAAIVLFRLSLPVLPKWFRQVLLLGFSAYFLSSLANAANFAPVLLVYLVLIIALGQAIMFAKGWRQSALMAAACVFAVLVLALFKYAYLLESVNVGIKLADRLRALHWIGLSYLTFKAIDYCLAMRLPSVAEQRNTSWLFATSYLLFFPAFISGPINRFAHYLSDQNEPPRAMSGIRLRNNVLRASLGVVKILFFARIARAYSLLGPELEGTSPIPVLRLTRSLYCYYLYFYFDFSGYCDAAIAVADFLEVRLPENFRYPFLASSPQDFWNRWHITLSHWVRDRFFFPLLRLLVTRGSALPTLLASVLSIFATFTLVGAWHGDRPNWVFYGMYHGFALSAELCYRSLMERFWPDLYERLLGARAYRALTTFLTFNFVAWGLLLTLPLPTAWAYLQRTSL